MSGIPFNLHPTNEDLSNHIRRTKDFYEAEILDYIRDNFPKQEVIIDVGANIGNHTVYFASFLNPTVVLAIEPEEANCSLLVRNAASFNNIIIFKMALGDYQGPCFIIPHWTNMGMASIVEEATIETQRVEMTTLDRLLNGFAPRISLIKIDVENWEPRVLAGAAQTLQKFKPLILIEDNYNTYKKLLPDYEVIMGWEQYKTYLYKWKEE